MSETEKPVKCVCGSNASVSDNGKDEYWVECGASRDCGRVGPASTSPDAAVKVWNSDMHALKHFPAVLDALDDEMASCRDSWDATDCQTTCEQEHCHKRDVYFKAIEGGVR